MITNLLTWLRPITRYNDPLTEQRARGLLIYLIIGFFLSLIAALFVLFQSFQGTLAGDPFFSPVDVPSYISPVLIVAFWWAVRHGYYRSGAVGLVVLSLSSLIALWNSDLTGGAVLAYTLPIITAGLLLGWRATGLVAIAVIGAVAGPTLINNSDPINFFVMTLVLAIIGTLIITFGTNVQFTATRFIRESNKLRDVITSILNSTQANSEDDLVLRTINLVRDQLGYTFARVYMVEDREVIQRMQTGLNLREINIDSDIRFGQRSGIYEAINGEQTIIIPVDADELVRQHLLSGTRTALAVPVFDKREQVIAVLDIQSEDVSGFAQNDLQTVSLIAQQFGQSLEHLRQINNLRRDLLEQDDLLARQRDRLLQYERAEQRNTTETWREYLEQQGVDYLGYDFNNQDTSPVEAVTMTPQIEAAIQTGDISVEQDGDMQIVSVPISLRGQSLGAMTFRVPAGTQVIGARQQELVRNVVQRLSLALENKRLFEQSQSQATREITANQVGNLLLSTTDINTVLKLAAENFNEALGAVQTRIRLKPETELSGESEGQS